MSRLDSAVLRQFDTARIPLGGGTPGAHGSARRLAGAVATPAEPAEDAVPPTGVSPGGADESESEGGWDSSGEEDEAGSGAPSTEAPGVATLPPAQGAEQVSETMDELTGQRLVRAPSLTAQFKRPRIQKKRLPSRKGRGQKSPAE